MSSLEGKLYDVINDVKFPVDSHYDVVTQTYRKRISSCPAVISIYWPDGFPCCYMEMYLLDMAYKYTVREDSGGSLGVIASDLTHLLRFCWVKKKDFHELYSEDFYEFVMGLTSETLPHNESKTKRNGNTVRRIIDNCIHFLGWLQLYILADKKLVGLREDNPQIRCVLKKGTGYFGGEKVRMVYPYRPTSSTPDPKRPMPSSIRNKLWEAVAAMSDPGKLAERYRKRFKNEKSLREELDYLRERRELILSLFEATGCRPSEQVGLLVKENSDCSFEKKIVIPTMKTRKTRTPKRKIPIEFGISVKLDLFISKHRAALLRRLREHGVVSKTRDHVLLCCRKGTPLSAGTIEREFHRIVKAAGINQRACVSMFRHRFITRMVIIHLQAFLDNTPGKTRGLMTDSDYRTILKRVAVFTGHKSLDSLMHYMDLAWDEIGVFNYVQPAHDLVNIIDGMANTFTSLLAEINLGKKGSSRHLLERVLNVLNLNRDRILTTVEAIGKNKAAHRDFSLN